MANTRTPPTEWVDEGLRALATGGPDNVRIEHLARALGVTKGGFYWHFNDRNALLDAMIDRWEQRLVDDVMEQVESAGGNARTKLRRLFALASDEAVTIDLAVRDWARHNPALASRLRTVDNRRMDYMRSLFSEFTPDEKDVEVRCFLAYSVWIGDHFIAADHGTLSRKGVKKLILNRLMNQALSAG